MIDKLNGKCYWTNLKCFFNGENSLHTPTPPILHDDKFVTDF